MFKLKDNFCNRELIVKIIKIYKHNTVHVAFITHFHITSMSYNIHIKVTII